MLYAMYLRQSGEISAALFVFVLFCAIRYGPNARFTALSPDRLGEEEFWNVQSYLLIIFFCESIFTMVAIKVMTKVKSVVNPNPNLTLT